MNSMICTTVGKYCFSLLSAAIIDNMNKSTSGRIFFGLEVIDQNHEKVSQTFRCGKRRQRLNQRDSAYLLSLKRLLSLLNDTSYEHWPHVGHPPQTCPCRLAYKSIWWGRFSLEILFFPSVTLA